MPFAIASGHHLTTASAENILREGGTAVDALLAAAFTAFVVEPMLAGPLGGGVAMIEEPGKAPAILDAFVQTPRRMAPEADLDIETITVDFGAETQDFHIGAATTATPCLIPALCDLHAKLGRMPLPELTSEAVTLARKGHTVTAFQSHVLHLIAAIVQNDPGPRAIYTEDETLLTEGKTLSNPDFADVLETLGLEGPRFFSEGEIATTLTALPGSHLGAADLKGAAAIRRQPLQTSRNGFDIWLNPAPSLGGLSIAAALEALPEGAGPLTLAKAFDAIDRLRAQGPIDTAALRALLTEHKAATRGTTHISIMDGKGLTAALTLSNGEGCGRVLPGTGIMPNNMLGEEDLCPDGPLHWQPDTRLATMMCPMLIRGENGTTALGSGGSSRIRTALTQVTLHLTEGKSVEDAITAPRLHMEKGNIAFEDAPHWAETLRKAYPEARVFDRAHMFFGGTHATTRTTKNQFSAAADPRRDGSATTG